jgi:hypothetical protein
MRTAEAETATPKGKREAIPEAVAVTTLRPKVVGVGVAVKGGRTVRAISIRLMAEGAVGAGVALLRMLREASGVAVAVGTGSTTPVPPRSS